MNAKFPPPDSTAGFLLLNAYARFIARPHYLGVGYIDARRALDELRALGWPVHEALTGRGFQYTFGADEYDEAGESDCLEHIAHHGHEWLREAGAAYAIRCAG